MATKARKLASNAKYLSKFKSMQFRVLPEEYEKLKAAADLEEKGSVQAYVLGACRSRMKKDEDDSYTVTLPREAVRAAAAAHKITPEEYLKQAKGELTDRLAGQQAYRDVEANDPLLLAISSLTLEQREALTVFLQRLQ